MTAPTADDIQQAVAMSGITGYSGNFTALGGGEVNDTYLLHCNPDDIILRVARYPGQETLVQEAHALGKLNLGAVPTLIYFNAQERIKDCLWIMETPAIGSTPSRLSVAQYKALGTLLAEVHKVQDTGTTGVNLWNCFLDASQAFGTEKWPLEHPDSRVKKLIHAAHAYFTAQQPAFNELTPSLIHGDATPSNTLVAGDTVSLIDWEFSKFKDPMAEFSTIYYEDMEYNQGKWRVQITDQERTALFTGYQTGGGTIAEDRIAVWMILDKIGAAVFLYWRLHHPEREASSEQLIQYKFDLDNLLDSLENSL